MNRILAFVFGLAAYIAFLGTFLYAIGFVAGVVVPKSIDTGPVTPVVRRYRIGNQMEPSQRLGESVHA